MNQAILVGRLISKPEIEQAEFGNRVTFTIAINRPFKNLEGIYETDFIRCSSSGIIAESMLEYYHEGDIVGIKGRLQAENHGKNYTMQVVAEKITFLTSNKIKDEEKNDEVDSDISI